MATSTARKTPVRTGTHATGRTGALAAAKAKIASAAPKADRTEAPKAADQLLNGVRTADRTPAPAPRRANRTTRAANASAAPKATKAAPARGPRARMPSPAKPAPAPAPAPEPKAPTYTKSDAKADLVRTMLLAMEEAIEGIQDDDPILGEFDLEEAGQIVANMVHHFPTGKAEDGSRWWTSGALPRPDRSEWR